MHIPQKTWEYSLPFRSLCWAGLVVSARPAITISSIGPSKIFYWASESNAPNIWRTSIKHQITRNETSENMLPSTRPKNTLPSIRKHRIHHQKPLFLFVVWRVVKWIVLPQARSTASHEEEIVLWRAPGEFQLSGVGARSRALSDGQQSSNYFC